MTRTFVVHRASRGLIQVGVHAGKCGPDGVSPGEVRQANTSNNLLPRSRQQSVHPDTRVFPTSETPDAFDGNLPPLCAPALATELKL